jgi:translocation and assembly module TamA
MKSAFLKIIFLVLPCILVFPAYAGAQAKNPSTASIEVTVEGIANQQLENVLNSLSIEQLKGLPHVTAGLVRRLHLKAPDEIRKALQPFGYYRPTITSRLQHSGKIWHAVYTIDPGEPVRITHIDFSISGPGGQDRSFQDLIRNFPLKEGDPFVHAAYEETKTRLERIALNRGYLDSRLTTHRVEVSPEKESAAVFLHFETGPQYYFGEVTFSHNPFMPEFLKRFIPFRKGDPFSQRQLYNLYNALHDGGYFSDVQVEPRRDLARERQVPIEVALTPHKRNQYTFGVGYGTDTGARGSLGWESRRLNRWGHRMDTELKVSEVKDAFIARYIVPLRNPVTDHLDYTAGWLRERTDTSESATYLAGISRHQIRGPWSQTFYVNYQQERFTVGDEKGRSNLFMPGTSWTRIRSDDRIFTTHGYRILVDLRGAHETLFSDTSFLQLRLFSKFIQGVGKSGRFILRGEGGTSLVRKFEEIPASVRFFAGGDQSVRGYAYHSLGPVDENGDVVGGKHLLVGSVEYEHLLYGKWSVALFYDIGNAFDSISTSYKRGTGLGVRWRTPIGPIRLDLASALSKPGNPLRIHLTIGPDL